MMSHEDILNILLSEAEPYGLQDAEGFIDYIIQFRYQTYIVTAKLLQITQYGKFKFECKGIRTDNV